MMHGQRNVKICASNENENCTRSGQGTVGEVLKNELTATENHSATKFEQEIAIISSLKEQESLTGGTEIYVRSLSFTICIYFG